MAFFILTVVTISSETKSKNLICPLKLTVLYNEAQEREFG
jgi:hypothetical protein